MFGLDEEIVQLRKAIAELIRQQKIGNHIAAFDACGDIRYRDGDKLLDLMNRCYPPAP